MSWRHHPLSVAVAVSLLLHGLLLLVLPLASTRHMPAPAPLQIELLTIEGPRAAASSVPATPVHPHAVRPSVSSTAAPAPVPARSTPTDAVAAGIVSAGAADSVAQARPATVGAGGDRGNVSVPAAHPAIEPARFLGNARNPPYPERARALGLEGRVEVKVTVGAGGEVLNVELLRSSGQVELDRAALALLAAGPYAPARRAGVAMASRLRIGVPYTLNK